MIDDNNKDPTFVYTVPDTVYKVPSQKEHAAQLLELPIGLSLGLGGDTFLEKVKTAFYLAKSFEQYSRQLAIERASYIPAPFGNAEIEVSFEDAGGRAMKAAFDRLGHAGRSLSDSSDEGLWVPVKDD